MEDINSLVNLINNSEGTTRKKAIISLGKTGDEKAVEPLLILLRDDETIRDIVLIALSCVPDPRSIKPIIELIRSEKSEWTRGMAADALGKFGSYAVAPMITALEDKDKHICIAAATILGEIKDPIAIEPLYKALISPLNNDLKFIQKIIKALASIGGDGINSLLKTIKSPNQVIRYETIKELAFVKDSNVVQPLIEASKDKNPDIRQEAALALGTKRNVYTLETLINLLGDSNQIVVVSALISLENLANEGVEDAFDALIKLIDHPSDMIKVNSVKGLGRLGDPRALPALQRLMASEKGQPNPELYSFGSNTSISIAEYAEQAIKDIQSKSY